MRLMAILLATSSLIGCAAGDRSPEARGPHAACAVCSYNGDLACVDVAITDSTPRLEENGHTRYFCSEECKAEFAKHPKRYAAR
jgi:YHS domain-containing protein